MPLEQKYWEAAKWWRRHSLESAIPEQYLRSAAKLEELATHIIANPELYQHRGELTDWQIYQRRKTL